MGRFRQGKIIGLAVAVCLIVICGVLLWRAKPHKTEETLVISHALKEDKGSNTTHKKQAEKNSDADSNADSNTTGWICRNYVT